MDGDSVREGGPFRNDDLTIPGYTLGESIGAGGFGEVFRARHELMGRDVAIKILHRRYSSDPDAVARFIAEARAASRISHPGIVNVFDFGTLADGRQYCVMELLRGRSLHDRLRDQPRIPLAEAVPILRSLAEAVDAAHAAGIAHRDLKPDNVFLLDGGGIKLIDFGLAKLVAAGTPLTATGAVFGTPSYMSPEQCRGRASDVRTDLYSFGVLVYQVLTGELPFTGDALEIALHHLNEPPVPPSARCPELDARVDRVLLALLAKDPAARPSPLAAMIDALAGAGALPPRQPRRVPRGAWIALGLATTAAASIGITMKLRSGSGTSVGEPACASAPQRLTGTWDAPARASVEARFRASARRDAAGTWRALAAELDGYSARWAVQWDDVCRAPHADPLAFAQRTACLDRALVDLGGVTSALRTEDVTQIVDGWRGDFLLPDLADCRRPEVLRALAAPPNTADRAKIGGLVAQAQRVLVHTRALAASGQRRMEVQSILGKLDEAADTLAPLDVLAADALRRDRAWYLTSDAGADSWLREIARQGIEKAIATADAARDDQALAADLAALAAFQLGAGELAKAEETLARGDSALARAGGPALPRRWLARARAELEARRGHLAIALTLLEAAGADSLSRALDGAFRTTLLVRAARFPEAIAQARADVATVAAAFGDDHAATVQARATLAAALERASDLDGALDELGRAIANARTLGSSALPDLRARQLDLAIRLGRPDLAALAAFRATRGETAIPGALLPEEWLAIAHAAFRRGALPTARDAIARVPATVPPATVARADDLRAKLDVVAGDRHSLASHAHDVPVDTLLRDGFRFGPHFLALLDAANGKRAAAEARLARLAALHTGPDEIAANAYQADAYVLAGLGRGPAAIAALDKARAAGRTPTLFAEAENDAWRGLLSPPRDAIAPLEQALYELEGCCGGFAYFAPHVELALARARWDTGADRPRARQLAAQADADFSRIGDLGAPLLFETSDRAAALRWIDEHPAARDGEPVLSTSGCPEPANPARKGRYTVFVNTEGVTLVKGPRSDAHTNTSSSLATATLVMRPLREGDPKRAELIANSVRLARSVLRPYSIDLVTTRPPSGDYLMIAVGNGDRTPYMPAENAGSITPFSCGYTPNEVDLFFEWAPAQDVWYANMFVSDIASMLGLTATSAPLDCMCRFGDACTRPDTQLCAFVSAAPTTEFQNCGRSVQDGPAMLKAAVGCR